MKNIKYDIKKLESKRQKNVQEQNFIEEYKLFLHAKWFRENAKNKLLIINSFLLSKGIEVLNSLILHNDMSTYEDGDFHSGLVLTQEGLFYEYEVELNDDRTEIVWEEWTDVTLKYPVTEHLPGTGKSFGWLCSSCLKHFNNQTKI